MLKDIIFTGFIPIRIFFTEETVGTTELMFVMGDFAPGEGLDPEGGTDLPRDTRDGHCGSPRRPDFAVRH